MTAHHHYHVPRQERLAVMRDAEIASVSRCYRCGGHHVRRFPRVRLVPLRVAIGGVIAAAVTLAAFALA